ncbi:hypothetical protein OLMES_4856 [Oleiphilus messinensis]|uniref:Uncharacterized protein n=2 Tax=Oleiphilus messinensis TaxID=141451 RepID=A0A1Y0IHI4_9GAMM|nr:hypothetical protein OLMES_4856 [Oleiphilus messinensis]
MSYFLVLPSLAAVIGAFYTPALRRQWLDYAYSMVIYGAAVPGIFSAILVFYTLFFLRGNLLSVNALIYFLPLLSMGGVFYLVRRKVDFERLPGFGKLSGLMTLIALVCLATLMIYKMVIFVGFVAPIEMLLIIGVVLFIVLKKAVNKISS